MLSIHLVGTLVGSTLHAGPLPPPPPQDATRSALATALQTQDASASAPPWSDLPPLTTNLRSLLLQDEAPSEQPAAAFGAEGSTRWSITGRWGIDVMDSGNNEYGLGLGLQWFLVDDFAFAPEINLWGFSQEGENAVGGSLDLMFQWHVINGDGWSLYGDFGCGMLGTNHNVPFDGSQFNFTPQAGLGVTFDVGQDRRWIIGVRWHHISNATLYQNNPGRDSVLVYTGISFPF
ncbi:MAG: acyloxyacyl hydrolase [Phycisphaerales bacterium]|jgi:hypothetical protein|nr:acyloxyacyl hydrolase [Phycisphaerales bacterium]